MQYTARLMMQLRNTPKRRPKGRSQKVADAVLAAAIELLETEGGSALTLERIAEKAGVNRVTLYRRWQTKARLLAWALIEHQNARLETIDSGSLEKDMVELLLMLDQQLASPSGLWFLRLSIVEATGDPAVAEAMRSFWDARYEAVGEIVRRAARREELASDIDVPFFLERIIGILYLRRARGASEPIARDRAVTHVRSIIAQP
jgi:AcrR family transcriptional regulator